LTISGRHQRVGKVDGVGGVGRRRVRVAEEADEPLAAHVEAQQVPAAVDDEGWIGLLLGQHVIEGAVDDGELRRAQRALAPHRRKPGGQQQRILLAQRKIERRRQPQHHLAARRRAPHLQEAQVPLRHLRGVGERQLRQAPPLPPPAQPRRKRRRRVHYYPPRS
jgi:hypothetical protein